MWLLLLCSATSNPFALAAVVVAFFTERRGWRIGIGVAALALGVMTLVLGTVSYLYWMTVVDRAVAFADPEVQTLLIERGREEAMNNIWFGLCGSVLPVLFGAFAVARGAVTKPETGGGIVEPTQF